MLYYTVAQFRVEVFILRCSYNLYMTKSYMKDVNIVSEEPAVILSVHVPLLVNFAGFVERSLLTRSVRS